MSEHMKTKNVNSTEKSEMVKPKYGTYLSGVKLYKFINDKDYEMLRIKRYDHATDSYEVIDFEGNKFTITNDEAHNDYTMLNYDGIISFNIVYDATDSETQSDRIEDVMICLHPILDENRTISPLPQVVCRQDCIDIFSMAEKATPVAGQVWGGCSISQRTIPVETSIESFMNCNEYKYTTMIAVYIDDTIDDWLKLIYYQKFDTILERYKKKHSGDNLIGISTSLKDLIEDKGFMVDFHETFDIIEVPFVIWPGQTDHLLKQIISDIKSVCISNVYVLPFTKHVDLKKIKRPYMLMTPSYSEAKPEDRKIYIVGYDIDSGVDYLTAKYGAKSKKDLISKLGFKEMKL